MDIFTRRKIARDKINWRVSQWANSNKNIPLQEYLGMTKKEFKDWLEKEEPPKSMWKV
jgi:hypothetical protein